MGTAVLVPAGTVKGVCTLELNPTPEGVIVKPDTVTLTELGFVRVRLCDELLPTTTLPNEIDAGERLSVGTA